MEIKIEKVHIHIYPQDSKDSKEMLSLLKQILNKENDMSDKTNQINEKVDKLQADVDTFQSAIKTATDAYRQQIADLKAKLAAGASPEELDAIIGKMDSTTTDLEGTIVEGPDAEATGTTGSETVGG